MPAPLILNRHLPADALSRLAAETSDPAHARRLRAIAMCATGCTRGQVAYTVGVSVATLRDWVSRYNAEGPAGLRSARSPGRPPKLSELQIREFERVLAALCKRREVRLSDIAAIVDQRFHVSYDNASVGRLMRGLGFTWKDGSWQREQHASATVLNRQAPHSNRARPSHNSPGARTQSHHPERWRERRP